MKGTSCKCIRVLIAKKKIKRVEVAKVLGISDMTLRNKLGGKCDWTLNEIRLLAKALDMSYQMLMGYIISEWSKEESNGNSN